MGEAENTEWYQANGDEMTELTLELMEEWTFEYIKDKLPGDFSIEKSLMLDTMAKVFAVTIESKDYSGAWEFGDYGGSLAWLIKKHDADYFHEGQREAYDKETMRDFVDEMVAIIVTERRKDNV